MKEFFQILMIVGLWVAVIGLYWERFFKKEKPGIWDGYEERVKDWPPHVPTEFTLQMVEKVKNLEKENSQFRQDNQHLSALKNISLRHSADLLKEQNRLKELRKKLEKKNK